MMTIRPCPILEVDRPGEEWLAVTVLRTDVAREYAIVRYSASH